MLFGLIVIASPSGASAAAGDLDSSFSGDGIAIDPSPYTAARSVAVDSNGRVVVLDAGVVLRFLPNGTLDQSFSGDGRAAVSFYSPGYANSVATDAQNRVVVGGSTPPDPGSNAYTFALARLRADGTPDPSFSGDGQVVTQIGGLGEDEVRGVAIDRQGRIVAAGWSWHRNHSREFALARYLANGSPDTSFSGDGQTRTQFPNTSWAAGSAVAIDSKGRIVVAGVAPYPDRDRFAVARYGPGGSLDPSFSQDGRVTTVMSTTGGAAFAVAVDASDRIVAAGGAVGKFALARYAPNGTLDQTFSDDGRAFTSFGRIANVAYGVAIDDRQRIVAAGATVDSANKRGAFALARYTPTGALDPAFSADGRVTTSIGPYSAAYGLALDPYGRIVVAGNTSSADLTDSHAVVARYLSR